LAIAGLTRRAGHAFYAAGDHHLRLAQPHGARRHAGGFHARPAQAVHGCARDLDRQPGEKAGHARDVAIVLAGLVDAAIDHVVDGAPVDILVALHQRLDRQRRKIVDPYRGQRAVVSANGGTHGVANEGVCHGLAPGGPALSRTSAGYHRPTPESKAIWRRIRRGAMRGLARLLRS
jgi:hypothetical protein